jgi:hypothetical protein
MEGQIDEGLCFQSSFGKKKGQRGRSLLWRRHVRWWFLHKIETGLARDERGEQFGEGNGSLGDQWVTLISNRNRKNFGRVEDRN